MIREDFQEFVMPSGAVCYYRDENHSYWESIKPKAKTKPEGEWQGSGRLTGVTTIVSPFGWDGMNALMAWAVRMNISGIAELAERCLGELEDEQGAAPEIPTWYAALDWLRDPEQIKARLRDAQLRDEDVRDEAGERGSNVHLHTLNALAAGMPVPAFDQLTEEERGYGKGVVQFWLDHDPEALQAEQVVYDPELRIAGRLDFRGYLRSRCGRSDCPCKTVEPDEIIVKDLKTSNYVGRTAWVQTRGYSRLARISGYGETGRCFILKVMEDGTYKLIESPATESQFLAAVNLYREAAIMDKEDRAMRKALEEA